MLTTNLLVKYKKKVYIIEKRKILKSTKIFFSKLVSAISIIEE